ncbi:unnamed protein product [Soboliphyme baturini]|uniref:Uncharacterized protein n=1 Tax=Soboliphyme baturini TaxID=241478 RepID=A0A183IJF0_9BILA|nr:unnamed protein product [Soboliphyme baturini]
MRSLSKNLSDPTPRSPLPQVSERKVQHINANAGKHANVTNESPTPNFQLASTRRRQQRDVTRYKPG